MPISLHLHVSPDISQVACLVELSAPGLLVLSLPQVAVYPPSGSCISPLSMPRLLVLSLPQEHGMALGLAPPQPHWNLSGLAAAAEVRLRVRVGVRARVRVRVRG